MGDKFTPNNIKGASDFLPATQIMRNRIIDTLKTNFEAYGFLPLETALLNYYELLSYKYDDKAEILREIYKLRDQGDRELGLRFDLTVPFCKVIAMNRNLRLPFKRYEIGKVFRNGPVKLGRTREFYQCDVDCVGVSGPHIEAEMVMLAVNCFLAIGIEPVIKIGSRKMLSDLIGENAELVIPILDRIGKQPREEILEELKKLNAEKILDIKIEPNDELKQLFAILDEFGLIKYYEFAPYLARGLNIYTGTVWEVYDKQKRLPSALGGGGRYDNIISNFIDNGQKYPAVGISFGLEPICAILNQSQSKPPSCIDLCVIPLGTESVAQTFAESLRRQGLRVLVYLGGKSVGKSFEYVNAENIPFAVVLGENETKSAQINLKNMETGEQVSLSAIATEQIASIVKGARK
jgi:histidyl-tRNA synthetase